MLWESKSPPEYNAGLLIQPADTGSPPLRETMEAQQHTGVKKHRGPRSPQRHRRGGDGNGEMQFASIFLSLLFPLISIKGCWMSTGERRKWPLSGISTLTERKQPNLPRSHTIQTYDDVFYGTILSLEHKRSMDKQPPQAFFFLSFPNGLGAPEQLRPLCLFSQSKISLSSCLNPAEMLHPDSNTSLQLLHSIIPCLPPFSPLL